MGAIGRSDGCDNLRNCDRLGHGRSRRQSGGGRLRGDEKREESIGDG